MSKNPGGSSSGPGVAVSAGLVTAALGTETDGSIVFPGTRQALFCLKPTVGIISQEGIVPISKISDSIGPMAKCVLDVAQLLDVLVDPRKPQFQLMATLRLSLQIGPD